MSDEQRQVVATFTTTLNGNPIAYSVMLGFTPSYTEKWTDDDGSPQEDVYRSECRLGLARHVVGADPFLAKDVWVAMDCDTDTFPTVADIDPWEWDSLFIDCGRVLIEFSDKRESYASKIHLMSGILKAAGVE